jgi:hypothetical protein
MESRGQALASSVRRVAKLVNISSKAEGERTWKTEFVRGRRGGVDIEEIVADVMEVRNGLLAIALIYPRVRFSFRNDTEGRR